MSLLQRWIFVIVIMIINAEVFGPYDWQGYVVALGIGAAASPLHKK
jgi:hypothetical protein